LGLKNAKVCVCVCACVCVCVCGEGGVELWRTFTPILWLASAFPPQGVYYRTNSSGCFGGNITAPGRRISFAQPGANGQIPSVSQWFEFGRSNMNEQFMGSTTYNGENVQQWRADLSNSTANTTMVLNYYFSDPGWTVWNGNGSQYPVALDLVGSRPTFGSVHSP
jgi:hypothetical protein